MGDGGRAYFVEGEEGAGMGEFGVLFPRGQTECRSVVLVWLSGLGDSGSDDATAAVISLNSVRGCDGVACGIDDEQLMQRRTRTIAHGVSS